MDSAEAFLYALFLVMLFFVWVRVRIEFLNNKKSGLKIHGIAKSMTIGSRELQEDAVDFAVKDDGFMLVLADGMGREYAGRISSNLAVGTFKSFFQSMNVWEKPQYYFQQSFSMANQKILTELDDQYGGAAVAVALVRGNKLWYALAGNVQIAIFRDGDLISITNGHTIGALAMDKWRKGSISRSDALRVHENKRIYNYLGQDGFKDIESMDEVELKAGDSIILMSDGVYDCLRWRDIEDCLKYSNTVDDTVYKIVELVNENDGHDKDNASVVLARL